MDYPSVYNVTWEVSVFLKTVGVISVNEVGQQKEDYLG